MNSSVCKAFLGNHPEVEDLFQEIALQVWRSIPQFKGRAAVSSWIYRICINTSIAWTRKEKKHRSEKEKLLEGTNCLKRQESRDDRLDWLYEQIAHLSKIDRTLTLLLLDGFSYKEMAKLIGISEANVGVKIHRIKKHLIEQSKNIHHGV